MRILVTGGAGFIGSNLTRRLLADGHDVVAVDNFQTSSSASVNELKRESKFSFFRHDIVQPLPRAIMASKPFDRIYHLACPTGVPNLTLLAEEMLLTCSLGTRNVLELARKHKSSFLLTSSSEIYGDPLASPQTETYTGNVDPTGIRSPYEEGKRFSESLVVMYAHKYRLHATIVRIFNTYGPYMSLDDTRVVPRLLLQAMTGKPLTIHGNGRQKRTFCYVDDLVAGLMTVMEKGTPSQAYNIGSDRQITIAALAKRIVSTARSSSTIASIDRPTHDHQSRLPDLTKIKRLGWSATIDLAEGLKKTIEWLRYREKSS